jgi:hypothetical protein
MILTVSEIKDLAEFAGLTIDGTNLPDADDLGTEITIASCPAEGVKDDDGKALHYEHVAYMTDYPEEGCIGLGPEKVRA